MDYNEFYNEYYGRIVRILEDEGAAQPGELVKVTDIRQGECGFIIVYEWTYAGELSNGWAATPTKVELV